MSAEKYDGWVCESLRLTALWRAPEIHGAALTWDAVMGAPPERKQEQPRTGTFQVGGPVPERHASLELQGAPGRVDWVLSPVFTPVPVDLAQFPNIGELPEVLNYFDELLFAKAAASYAAPRFALGVVVTWAAASKDESYEHIAGLLCAIKPKLSGASEFMFQINRPRQSGVLPNLQVNRMSRWASVAFTGMHFTVGQTAGSAVTSSLSVPLHGTRLELDISSYADSADVIPEPSRLSLLREFASLALEIIDKGDVP